MKLLLALIIALFLLTLVSVEGFSQSRLFRYDRNRRDFSQLKVVTSVHSIEEFDEAIKAAGDKLVVIDYSTTWCVPCKAIAPKFAALSDRFPQVIFLKCVDGHDEHPHTTDLLMRERIKSVPAFHFWKDGRKQDSMTGGRIEDIEQNIRSFLQPPPQ
eukprot:gene14192-15691_t